MKVDPGNFAPGGPLEGLISSTITEMDPNDDIDNNDNGLDDPQQYSKFGWNYETNGVCSGTIYLDHDLEPRGESPLDPTDPNGGDGVPLDDNANMSVDFGFVEPGKFGNLVWEDENKDGLQDAGEALVQDVIVYLYQYDPATGNTTLMDIDTTDAVGDYRFCYLPPNRQYLVEFEDSSLPQDHIFTRRDNGGNMPVPVRDSIDSDAHPVSGLTIPTLISPAEEDTSWDAGIYEPLATIGDFVWYDNDRDGLQDPTEMGVPGVVLYLTDAAGDTLSSDTTDANGRYLFEDLDPGSYEIDFDLSTIPADYVVSPQNRGVTDASDSDADPPSGRTQLTSLLPDEVDLDWDMGSSCRLQASATTSGMTIAAMACRT